MWAVRRAWSCAHHPAWSVGARVARPEVHARCRWCRWGRCRRGLARVDHHCRGKVRRRPGCAIASRCSGSAQGARLVPGVAGRERRAAHPAAAAANAAVDQRHMHGRHAADRRRRRKPRCAARQWFKATPCGGPETSRYSAASGAARLGLQLVGPARQRRHRQQNGFRAPARLQAEVGAAVPDQVEFDIAAAPVQLELALAARP